MYPYIRLFYLHLELYDSRTTHDALEDTTYPTNFLGVDLLAPRQLYGDSSTTGSILNEGVASRYTTIHLTKINCKPST